MTFYSVIFPFRSTFAIKYFQHAHGLSLQEAGAMNGYVFLAAIFATPAVRPAGRPRRPPGGLHGARARSCCSPSSRSSAYTNLNLWVTTVLIGIAFSLVPAVLWPAVPYLVDGRIGSARPTA